MDRLAKASQELEFARQFDVILLNETLEDTLAAAENMVRNFLVLSTKSGEE